jgi:hypothetical protein
MHFHMQWELKEYIRHLDVTPSADMWNRILCLTGSINEAQLVTVADYVNQTWPVAGEHLLSLLYELVLAEDGQECICRFPNLVVIRLSRTH